MILCLLLLLSIPPWNVPSTSSLRSFPTSKARLSRQKSFFGAKKFYFKEQQKKSFLTNKITIWSGVTFRASTMTRGSIFAPLTKNVTSLGFFLFQLRDSLQQLLLCHLKGGLHRGHCHGLSGFLQLFGSFHCRGCSSSSRRPFKLCQLPK